MYPPKIILVDDDDDLAAALEFLFIGKNWQFIRFNSGESFIDGVKSDAKLLDQVGAVLLDVRMTGLSGYDVFSWLQKNYPKVVMSAIFLTGHGELSDAVRSMKFGAFDFVTKPFESKSLIRIVSEAIKKSNLLYADLQMSQSISARISQLTEKEEVVMKRIYCGDSNKLIADSMGNSTRTIELHRAAIFDKLGVKNAVEMVRLLNLIGFTS
ncbi:response regulator transcription factor [Polynucleobacter paneuropaeus]|nr:response regulator transcription factor [Polynucleobacter paneuropaeus]